MSAPLENPSFADARRRSDPLIGEMIGDRYRVERVLGTGGTGTVYLAEHVMMEKRVALKVLHATHAVISSAMDRFQREAIALARIEHPNVVSATDFGKLKNGAYYLALEYVEGVSLGDVLAQDGALEQVRALGIAYQIASALTAAHSQSIVHRDLKPHNVMLTQVAGVEVVKVLDFGLAKLRSKLTEGSISMTAGQVFGTPHYMAPEQIGGEGVDHRVDLYALGVILYEMLSGERPFDARDVREILALQATADPKPLSERFPATLRALVQHLMAKEKDERPATAEEVLAELEPLVRHGSSIRSSGMLDRQLKVGSFSIPAWAVALPSAAFLALFAVGLLWSQEEPEAPQPSDAVAQPRIAEDLSTQESDDTPPPSDRRPALIADAEFGDARAIDELLEIPKDQRDRELWLVLIKGRLKQEGGPQAMQLLREAVHANPTYADDEEFTQLVRIAAGDPKAAKLALANAAEILGTRGVDILFSTWADTKERTPTTALAEQYLQDSDVRDRGSDAVKLALALRDELDCEKARQLLEQAKEYGDSRSLRPMAKLRKKRGCGEAKRSDCYPCLRNDELLEEAIAKAAARAGPKY